MISVLIDKDKKLIHWGTAEQTVLEEGQTVVNVNKSEIDKLIVGNVYDENEKTFKPSIARQFQEIRHKRDTLLKESDYTQLSDSTYPGTKEEWITYRQKLRDLTKDVSDPSTIVFPSQPN